MKTPKSASQRARIPGVWVIALFLVTASTRAADFSITYTGDRAYAFNGSGANPTITLIRGQTYTFDVSTPANHPFQIISPADSTIGNNTFSGTITFHVPTNAAFYSYRCSAHGFGGPILTIPPPTFHIVKLGVGPALVVQSTGTNNWILEPQFSTNLSATNWFALTVLSNRVVNGTNETFCGRPQGDNVSIRIKAQRN